jgi:hypothetical protein
MATTKRKITTYTQKRKPRIWELANELGVEPSVLMAAARNLRMKKITAPASAVDEEQERMLREAVMQAPPKKAGKKAPRKAPKPEPEAPAKPRGKKKARKKKKASATSETQLVIVRHPARRGNPAFTDVCLRAIKGL